jgi:5-methylthioadenosine/S-adenosylhomocysteine deaminase
MRWLREAIWPVEARLEDEDVYWGARLACLEMTRNGCSDFWDMYWHPEATARAVGDSGLRATIGGPLLDVEGDTEGARKTALASLDELAGFGPRIGASLAPHAICTVSEGLLRWTAETAAEREVPIHIHLSETEQEVTDCLDRHGVRSAAYLDRLGLLGERTILAHGVWLDRAELELIAEPRLHGRRQPGRQHEARRRRRPPLSRGAPRRRAGRARHRRAGLQRLARPALRPQGLRPLPAPRRRRCHRDPGP